MSQASTANIKPRATVVSRTLIWEGAIVAYKVPATAEMNEFKNPTLTLRYLSTRQAVKRGVVYVHVHLPEGEELRGKKIVARASVWNKTLSNGCQYLHIDLRPTQGEVSHRFVTVPELGEVPKLEGWHVIEIPHPLEGAIIFMPPNAIMPAPTSRLGLTADDCWIGGVPAEYTSSSNPAKKEPASAAQIGDLASKFKVTERKKK